MYIWNMVGTVCHLNYKDNVESKEWNTRRKKNIPAGVLGAYRCRRHIYIKHASNSRRIYIYIYIYINNLPETSKNCFSYTNKSSNLSPRTLCAASYSSNDWFSKERCFFLKKKNPGNTYLGKLEGNLSLKISVWRVFKIS